MKNKSLPVMLVVTVLLFILTGLMIVFLTDYYSAYGKYSDDGSLYDGRSSIFGTKALDAEAVQNGFERTRALQEFMVIGAGDNSVFDYGLSRYSLPGAAAPAVSGGDSPVSNQAAKQDPEILYVVYNSGLTESGGY